MRKRKNEENEWNWEGRIIDQVNGFKYLGYNERATDKRHIREIVRKANKVVGCVWGIGERKEQNDDVREHDREYIDVWGRDLGMEGTRRGRESARKIFERSGERNSRLREECKRNRLRMKA
jgi:hypothetical protein